MGLLIASRRLVGNSLAARLAARPDNCEASAPGTPKSKPGTPGMPKPPLAFGLLTVGAPIPRC